MYYVYFINFEILSKISLFFYMISFFAIKNFSFFTKTMGLKKAESTIPRPGQSI